MGKAFSDKEREIVRNRLLEVGEVCFTESGLKKTSIEVVTEKAGIGRGTFYHFFSSKEDLYLTVIELVSERVQASLLKEIEKGAEAPEATFRLFLEKLFMLADENPLLGVLFTRKEVLNSLLNNLPDDRVEAFLVHNDRVIRGVLQALRATGMEIAVSPEIFAAMVRGFNLMSLHRDIIAVEEFRCMIKIVAGAVADKLLEGSGRATHGVAG